MRPDIKKRLSAARKKIEMKSSRNACPLDPLTCVVLRFTNVHSITPSQPDDMGVAEDGDTAYHRRRGHSAVGKSCA